MPRQLNNISLALFIILTACFLGIIAFSFTGCSLGSKPSIEEVKGPVETYLKNQKKCSGRVTVDKLIIQKIGDYDDDLDGWPVYAIFAVTCQEPNLKETWRGDEKSEAMTAVVRKKIGGYEAFMPKIFEEGFQKLDGMIQDLEQKMQSDWNKQFPQ
jgi:hypothetical protein